MLELFLFLPQMEPYLFASNILGSVHDSKIAVWGGIHNKLKSVYNAMGAKRTVNLAFNSKMNAAYLLKLSQNDVM